MSNKRVWINSATENLINQGMTTTQALLELKRITTLRIQMAEGNDAIIDSLLADLDLIEDLIKLYPSCP